MFLAHLDGVKKFLAGLACHQRVNNHSPCMQTVYTYTCCLSRLLCVVTQATSYLGNQFPSWTTLYKGDVSNIILCCLGNRWLHGLTGNWVEKWAGWELGVAEGQLEGVCVTLWKCGFRHDPALHSQYCIQKKEVCNQVFHKATHRGPHLYDKTTTCNWLIPWPEHVTVSK